MLQLGTVSVPNCKVLVTHTCIQEGKCRMFKYICKRLLMMVPVLIGISFVIFVLMDITPGDPARFILGDYASNEAVDALRDQLGLNDPFFKRYFEYLLQVIQGDFGTSWQTNVPVLQELGSRIPTTLVLALIATCLMTLIGVPLGIISAIKRHTAIDTVCTFGAFILASVPSFWLGLMMMLLFSLKLGWLPATGVGSIANFIMPSITLASVMLASLLRMSRSSMLEVTRQDYIRTARAKGADEKRIVMKHALRNALLPIITLVGLNFGNLMGGTLIIESVFAMPGLGTLIINSVKVKNTPVVLGGILFVAVCISVITLLVDIIYSFIDPRIRDQYSKG